MLSTRFGSFLFRRMILSPSRKMAALIWKKVTIVEIVWIGDYHGE